jgi:DNA-directed RNA polymerase subunit RPC12/RpoP
MEVTVVCYQCGSALPVEVSGESLQINCGRCGEAFLLKFSKSVRGDEKVDRCPVCEGDDFYLRKDFDPKMGVTVIVIAIFISGGFYYYGLDLIAYGVLAGAALIDLAVYRRLKDLTVCYRCHAEFRGDYEPLAGPFDLHTADELEPEYERAVGKR